MVVISCENMEKIIINSGFFLIVNHNSSNFFYSVDSVLCCMYNYVFLNEIISKMCFFFYIFHCILRLGINVENLLFNWYYSK